MTEKSDIHRERREITTQTASSVRVELTPTLLKAVDLAAVPGYSSCSVYTRGLLLTP